MLVRKDAKLDYKPQEIENLVLSAVEKQGRGFGWILTNKRIHNPSKIPVVFNGKEAIFVRDEEKADAVVVIGSSQIGGLVRIVFLPEKTRRGTFISSYVSNVLFKLDKRIGTEFGHMCNAPAMN
jgi:hypothetical protein